MSFDVVVLGETMLRFTPPGFQRFEQSALIELHIGGSESNTAVGLARLGKRVAWLSRLPRNPLGALIADGIRSHGVDVAHVAWSADERVGTYYLERGTAPRTSQVIYDRRDSAASRMTPEDLPAELFQPKRLQFFHTTGITLGISPSAAATAERAAELAKTAKALVSFDLNYRARLWTPEDAKHGCDAMMQMADIIFMPERDARAVCGVDLPDPEATLERLGLAYPRATFVLTLGARGAAARDTAGRYWFQPAFPAVETERLGGGDAFSAGFLAGYLETQSIADALRFGAATAAVKYTIPGDLPLIDRSTVETLVAGNRSAEIAR